MGNCLSDLCGGGNSHSSNRHPKLSNRIIDRYAAETPSKYYDSFDLYNLLILILFKIKVISLFEV